MKMKKIVLYLSMLCVGFSCNTLDVPPYNIIQDEQIFTSESGIEAYMASLYRDLPIEDFNFTVNGFGYYAAYPSTGNYSGELLASMSDMVWNSPNGDMLQMWQYDWVRKTNYFLQEFPNYSVNFPEDQANTWLGEAHFCRAYYYFEMVKRYGAVPLVTIAQNYPETSIEELQVPRTPEKDIYDFVAAELDSAIMLLPEQADRGRASKYVALAFKSRAMLYAASVAQFSTVPSGYENLLGIPQSEANHYFQLCFDAADQLEARFSLYRKYDDKFENYWRLFLDEDSEETIFVRNYRYPEYAHSWDSHMIPFQMRGADGYSSRLCPTLELIQLFENVNGEPLSLQTTDENGTPIRFDDRMDIFKDAEARLRGSVIFPGDIFKGEVIDIQKGLYLSYPNGELLTSSTPGDAYKNVTISGRSGMGSNETTSTGFLVRKYQNPDMEQASVRQGYSEQDWIDIRYAEVLLNKAEAAFYLGKKADALEAINDIRDRAGAQLLTETQLTEDAIRKERRKELAFENHTYWDLRRWRIADQLMNNTTYHALCPYYIYDEQKYIYQVEAVGGLYTYDVKANYVKIPDSEIQKNPNLLPNNPGY